MSNAEITALFDDYLLFSARCDALKSLVPDDEKAALAAAGYCMGMQEVLNQLEEIDSNREWEDEIMEYDAKKAQEEAQEKSEKKTETK